jgi:hypothetical protein
MPHPSARPPPSLAPAQARKAFGEAADIHAASLRGVDSGLLAALRPDAPVGSGLRAAVEACGVAAAHVADLQSHRAAVVEARVEALGARQKDMADARDALAASVTARLRCVAGRGARRGFRAPELASRAHSHSLKHVRSHRPTLCARPPANPSHAAPRTQSTWRS